MNTQTTTTTTWVDSIIAVAEQWLDNRWFMDTPEYTAASLASTEDRVLALKGFNLNYWKEALRALCAVTYGAIGGKDSRVGRLLELCYYAKRRREAYKAVMAFEAAGPELSFFENLVVMATKEVTSRDPSNPPAVIMEQVAMLAGLVAHNDDIEQILARGMSVGDKTTLDSALSYWAGLANQKGEPIEFPQDRDLGSIYRWASEELAASEEAEGSNAPVASSNIKEGDILTLEWEGSWTSGRNIVIEVSFDDDGAILDQAYAVYIRWDTGTGRPSTFLQMEMLLGRRGCRHFEPLCETKEEVE